MAKQEKRAQQRIGITVQLVEKVDDDLIEWLSRLPNGEKQSTIKALLRRALKLRTPEDDTRDELSELRGELRETNGVVQSLVDEVMRLRGELSQRPALGIEAPPIVEDDGARLSQEEIERRARRVDSAAW